MCLSQLFPQQCPTTNMQHFTTNVSKNEWHILWICGVRGLGSGPSRLTCWRICALTALGAILSPLPVVSPGGKVCLCCYGDVLKGSGTSLPSTLLQSCILFLKKNWFPRSPRKKRKAERACFKQSQEATISLCIMIRHGKARRWRRVLVPNPLNSLLCIRQQQQYKQTSQWKP